MTNRTAVKVESSEDGVLTLALNRPLKRNALTIELMSTLCAQIEQAEQQGEHRVLILRGSGLVFCAGLDLDEAAESAVAMDSAQWVAKTFETLNRTPLIVIAAAHGAAVAGGAGLMAACDFAIAAENLTISFPEVRRGLVPALVCSQLRDRLRDSELRELLLWGDSIDAARALQLGLVHRVVPENQLLDEAVRIAMLIQRGAPTAVRNTKRLIRELRHGSTTETLQLALQYHNEARASSEADEGTAAFLQKREPSW